MIDREQIIFERLLCLAANEYGKTRDEMLAWINDDSEDWRTDYPKNEPLKDVSGLPPYAQVVRTSTITVTKDMWNLLHKEASLPVPKNQFVGTTVSQARLAIFSDTDRMNMTTEDLAWLTHEAEWLSDDISVMKLADVAMHRPDFGEVYRGIWPQHAKARGYHKA